jgi:exopolyphosphatase/pppGpp-phosphohydrolase
MQEILEHAALLVDIGRSVDYYSRWEQAARIVASSDIYGFSHRDIVLISAVLEKAGSDRVRLPGYLSVLSTQDHAQVDRLAMILTLADELGHRMHPGEQVVVQRRRSGIVLLLPRDVGPLEGETERRFHRRFERRLRLAVAPA